MLKTSEVARIYQIPYRTLMRWIEKQVKLGPAFTKIKGVWLADPAKLNGLDYSMKKGDLTVELKMRMTPEQKQKLEAAAGDLPISTFIRRRFLEKL